MINRAMVNQNAVPLNGSNSVEDMKISHPIIVNFVVKNMLKEQLLRINSGSWRFDGVRCKPTTHYPLETCRFVW